jgi:organic radical activating enzyme
MGCDLSCSWCDSPWTWDATRFDLRAETTHRTAAHIADALRGGPPLVVLTGGEPLLQQARPAWTALLSRIHGLGAQVHIETNGTVLPSAETVILADTIIVSPKLGNAGAHRGHQDPTLHPGYRDLAPNANVHLKVVVTCVADVEDAVALAEDHGFPRHRIWVMPEGTTVEALQKRWPVVAETAAHLGVNASHRLHVLAWGDERGR